MMRFCLVFLLFSFVLEGNQCLTLSELIDKGLENHPKTRQAWWNAKRAAAFVGEAKSGYYPQMALNADAIHGRDFKFINGPDTNYTILRADLALSMLLYDAGERNAEVLSAKMALLAAGWETDFAMQKVIVDILENGYRLAYAEEAYEASLLSLEDAKTMLAASEKLHVSGLNPISDIYTSQSALSLMQIDTIKRKSLLDIQRGRLAASLNLPLDTPLKLKPFPLPCSQTTNLEELLQLAKEKRGDLAERRARISESASHVSRVNAKYKPKIFLDARGGYEHAFQDKAGGAHYQVVLNLELPVFNGFKSFYERQAACANLLITEENAADLELEIALEVLHFSRTVEASLEMIHHAEDNLNSAKKGYEGTLDKYEIGEESIAEVLLAQKELAQARILYNDIKTELLVSIAHLAFATGTLL